MSQTKAQLIDPVDGTIVNADINASAAIAASKIADFVTGNVNNRVLTASGTANSLIGEAGMLFTSDSNDHFFTLTGSGQAHLQLISTSGTDHCSIDFGDSDDNDIGEIRYTHSSNKMQFDTNAIHRMTLDSEGRLLLGTTTEGSTIGDDLTIAQASGHAGITIRTANDTVGSLLFSDATSGTGEYAGFVQYQHSSDEMVIGANAKEIVKIHDEHFNIVAAEGTLRMNFGFQDGLGGELSIYDQAGSQKTRITGSANTNHFFNNGGNVGIGLTNPDTLLHLAGGSPNIKLHNTGSSASANDIFGAISFQHSDADDAGITAIIQCVAENNAGDSFLAFHNGDGGNADERMRIHSNGHITMDKTNTADTSGTGFVFRANSVIPNMSNVIDTSTFNHSTYHLYNVNATNNAYRFYVQANGGIVNHSGNNVNLSDERMKKNITNMGSVYENFKKFVFRDFNYISDASSEIKKHGVIAQEVETIDADLITEDFKVDSDSQGNDIYRKGLREEQFMMIGFKALQEAIAKIETLETEVAALKAA